MEFRIAVNSNACAGKVTLCLYASAGLFFTRIRRINEDGSAVTINRGTNFYIFLGQKVEFICSCK